ncbi:MAG: hypothetical protein AAF502_24770 [Bacteroidota bacterium]
MELLALIFVFFVFYGGGLFLFVSWSKRKKSVSPFSVVDRPLVNERGVDFLLGGSTIMTMIIYFLFFPISHDYADAYADNKIDKLTIEIQGITNSLENIDNLSISEIKSELDKSLKYLKKIKEEAIIQRESINKLKLELAYQKEEADESIKQANTLKNLSEDEIEAIESLITANAAIENKKSFQRGVIISFPIGVLASLVATYIWTYSGRRRTNSDTSPHSQ